MTDKPSYTEIYLRSCDLIKESAEGKLERPLTPQELAHIYNSGSLIQIELVERGIEAASKENLSETLLSTSFAERLDEIKRNFPTILAEEYLGQPLDQPLIEKLNQLPYVYSVFQVILKMEQTPPESRYLALTQLLDELI